MLQHREMTYLCDGTRDSVPGLAGDGGRGRLLGSLGLEGGHGLGDPWGQDELFPQLHVGAALR